MRRRGHSQRAEAILVGAALAGLGPLAGGCATPQPGSDPSGSGPAATVAPSAATPPGTATAGPTESGAVGSGEPTTKQPPEATGMPITVRGTVTEGVERGCTILVADDGTQYLLLDGDPAVIGSGGRIEVRGTLETGVMTTCQQGMPMSVISARPVE